MATQQELLQQLRGLAQQMGPLGQEVLQRMQSALPQVIQHALTRGSGAGPQSTVGSIMNLRRQGLAQAMDDFWTGIDVPLDRIPHNIQHLERGLARARAGMNNWDVQETQQRINELRNQQSIGREFSRVARDYAGQVQNQTMAQSEVSLRQQRGEPVSSQLMQQAGMAQEQTPGRLASPLPPNGQSGGTNLAVTQPNTLGGEQRISSPNPGIQTQLDRIAKGLADRSVSRTEAMILLQSLGFDQMQSNAFIANVAAGGGASPVQPPNVDTPQETTAQDPRTPTGPTAFTPPSPEQAARDAANIRGPGGQTQQPPQGGIPTAQPEPRPAPSNTIDAFIPPDNEEDGGLGGPAARRRLSFSDVASGIGGSGLGDIDIMQQRGFADVVRGIAQRSGVEPLFRSLVERQLGQQQLPFALQMAMGSGGDQGGFLDSVTSPRAFESFIGGGGMMPIGQALRQAGGFLDTPLEMSPQQQTIQDLLTGPEGSVGSELFGPLLGELLAPNGRRFLPGLGQAARAATGGALQNTLAQDPGRFLNVPSFINFLADQGLI